MCLTGLEPATYRLKADYATNCVTDTEIGEYIKTLLKWSVFLECQTTQQSLPVNPIITSMGPNLSKYFQCLVALLWFQLLPFTDYHGQLSEKISDLSFIFCMDDVN